MIRRKITITVIFYILICYSCNIYTQTKEDVFAVFKVSYNGLGPPRGGIGGTAFFVNDSIALTANHILNSKEFIPNKGYSKFHYWLLSRNNNLIIPIKKKNLLDFQDIDLTVIKFNKPYHAVYKFKLSNTKISIEDSVYSKGYIYERKAKIKLRRVADSLVVDYYDLSNDIADREGFIVDIFRRSTPEYATDVKLKNVMVLQPSFKGIKGMSGGPLINKDDGHVIGLFSWGLPRDTIIPDTVFAISINEIKIRTGKF